MGYSTKQSTNGSGELLDSVLYEASEIKNKHRFNKAMQRCGLALVHKVELYQLLQMTPEARAHAWNQEHLKNN